MAQDPSRFTSARGRFGPGAAPFVPRGVNSPNHNQMNNSFPQHHNFSGGNLGYPMPGAFPESPTAPNAPGPMMPQGGGYPGLLSPVPGGAADFHRQQHLHYHHHHHQHHHHFSSDAGAGNALNRGAPVVGIGAPSTGFQQFQPFSVPQVGGSSNTTPPSPERAPQQQWMHHAPQVSVGQQLYQQGVGIRGQPQPAVNPHFPATGGFHHHHHHHHHNLRQQETGTVPNAHSGSLHHHNYGRNHHHNILTQLGPNPSSDRATSMMDAGQPHMFPQMNMFPSVGLMKHQHHQQQQHHGVGQYGGTNMVSTPVPFPTFAATSSPNLPKQKARSPSPQPQPEDTKDMYAFLLERSLIGRRSLSDVCSGAPKAPNNSLPSIAVDADYFLTRIREKLHVYDPLWVMHSCLPYELKELVRREVKVFRDANLNPIFVFGGIGANGDVESIMNTEAELEARDAVWETVHNLQTPESEIISAAFDPRLGEDIEMTIGRMLTNELNCTVLVAPFLSWAQMVALLAQEKVQLLFGPCEILLIGCENLTVIIDIEVNEQTKVADCAVVSRHQVLNTLFPNMPISRSGCRFLDLGLFTATKKNISLLRSQLTLSYDQIYHELSAPTPSYKSIQDMISRTLCVDPSVDRELHVSSQLLKHFKGRAFIKHCVVMSSKPLPNHEACVAYLSTLLSHSTTNGNTWDKKASLPPQNLCGVFGNYVPPELFFFMHVGLISVSSMTCITQSFVRDEAPIADSINLRENMAVVISLRTQVIHQLIRMLQDHATVPERMKAISWVRWFAPVLLPLFKPKDVIRLDGWQLDNMNDSTNLAGQATITGPMISLIDVLSCNANACSSVVYNNRKQHLFAVLLKSFDLLGYFTHAVNAPESEQRQDLGSGLSPFARAILSNITSFHTKNSFQFELVLLTEIVRTNTLTSSPLTLITKATMHTSSNATTGDARHSSAGGGGHLDNDSGENAIVVLCTRIACMLDVPHEKPLDKSTAFQLGENIYDRSTCSFMMMVRSMSKTLRDLLEVISVCLYFDVSPSDRRPPPRTSRLHLVEYANIPAMLPFGSPPSAIGAILLRQVLQNDDDYSMNYQTSTERLNYLKTLFPHIPELEHHLWRLFMFVLQALSLLKLLVVEDPDMVNPNLGGQLIEAEKLVQAKFAKHFPK